MPEEKLPTDAAVTSMKDVLAKAFGDSGIIPPEALPSANKANQPDPAAAPAAPDPAAAPAAPAPVPAPNPPAVPDPNAGVQPVGEPAAGATGAAPAPEGATGEGPTEGETGATGEPGPTDAQLDEAAKKMPVAAGTAFKVVRSENRTLKADKVRLEQELEAAKKAPVVEPTEVEDMKSRIKQYEDRLAIVDYQGTEEFQSKIAKPLAQAEGTLKALSEKYSVSAGDLASAIAEPDANKRSDRLSELSTNFNRLDTAAFDRSITDFDRLQVEKQAVLKYAMERIEATKAEQEAAKRKSMETFQKDWNSALDGSLQTFKQEAAPLFDTEDAEWNAKVEAAIGKVRAVDIARMPNDQLAKSLYQGAVLDLTLELITDLVTKNHDLDAEAVKLRGATPPAGGGAAPAPVKGAEGPTAGASFAEVLRANLPSILPG